MLKTCRICKELKSETEFYMNRMHENGKLKYSILRTECRECTDKTTRKYHQNNRERVIFNNCKTMDQIRGQETNITLEIIKSIIVLPCEYCGDVNGKISIDRIHSYLGHVIGNIVPCCVRCNSMKSDMPYEAWKMIQPSVKQAFEKGLFLNWIGHNGGSEKRGPRTINRQRSPDKRLRENRNPQQSFKFK